MVFLLHVLREGHICIKIGIGNGSHCLKISQATLISIGTSVKRLGYLSGYVPIKSFWVYFTYKL